MNFSTHILIFLYLDCLAVKVKENNQIINKSLFLTIGVNIEGVDIEK